MKLHADMLCPYCESVCEMEAFGAIKKCRACGVMWSFGDVYIWTEEPNIGWYSLPDTTLLVIGSEEL